LPMDTDGSPAVRRGLIVALLAEAYEDRIVLAGSTLFLRDGVRCPHAVGTPLQVEYIEQNGRRDVERITLTKIAK
jgi:hypothetical protein